MNPQSRFTQSLILILFALLGVANAHAAVNINYVVNNHLGAPVLLVDENQQVVWQAEYDEFGKATILVEEVEFNVRFPGQYYDKETGLTYNYYRDYDERLGRYVQSDPIGLAGGINTYGYAYQNPISNYDPDGRMVAALLPLLGIGASEASALINLLGFGAISLMANNWNDSPEANQAWENYKEAYDQPPPPDLDECELLKWKLKREEDLLAARKNWDALFGLGTHDKAIQQNINAINNLKKKIQNKCEKTCP